MCDRERTHGDGSGESGRFEYAHYFAAPNALVAYGVAFMLWALPRALKSSLVFRFCMLFNRSGSGPSDSGRKNACASPVCCVRFAGSRGPLYLRSSHL